MTARPLDAPDARGARAQRLATLPAETMAMTTRDGVRLDADIYRPAGDGPFPVLLMRQAYGRRIACTLCYAHPRWYASHGYIVVVQDIRGRGTSEGVFTLGRDDAEDGAQSIAWAAALPGSNGRVGMYGFSYQGYNQFMAASLAGPALRALAPAMAPWDPREGWSHSQGAFRLQSSLGWALQLAAETARHDGDAEAYTEIARAAKALPLNEQRPAHPGVMDRYPEHSHYATWRDTPRDHTYWQDISPAARVAAMAERRVPTLLVAGWYDSFLEGSLASWHALQATRAAPVHLVVGPWGHFPWVRRQGALDFGPDADGGMDALHVRWFDRWLKDEDNGVDHEAPLRLFDLGRKAWQDFATWPHRTQSLYLSGTGLASLDTADGNLRDHPDDAPGVDAVVTDPWRPAPSVGGAFGSPAGRRGPRGHGRSRRRPHLHHAPVRRAARVGRRRHRRTPRGRRPAELRHRLHPLARTARRQGDSPGRRLSPPACERGTGIARRARHGSPGRHLRHTGTGGSLAPVDRGRRLPGLRAQPRHR
nr:CocE/NonD family hydrolase [Verticiella sp. GG226]